MSLSKKYVKLDQREHVLQRPGMYIGSVEVDTYNTWVFDGQNMIKKTIQIIPGLGKIFDEVLINAVDHSVRLKQQEAAKHLVKNIKINIDRATGIIIVENDGDGIEIVKHPEHDIYIPQLIFGNMLTSTNYNDEEERIVSGTNGAGAKLTNIFSKFFEVETVDPVRKLLYKQRFEENMSITNEPVIQNYTKKPYTKITFLPEYSRFGMNDGLTQDMYDVLLKRSIDCCAITSGDVNIWLNDTKLEYKTFEKYIDLYLGKKVEHGRAFEKINDRWEIAASFNNSSGNSGFEQVSFVNGIWTIRGGKHVDYICNQITKKLIDVIQKKKKQVDIKPQTVKDNLILFIRCNIVNPTFDSQSKETLTTTSAKFGSKAEVSDAFIDKLYKTGIVDRILQISELNTTKKISKTDGRKRNIIRGLPKLEDANWAGTNKSKDCTLILTEGDSGMTMAISGLSEVGRDVWGCFPLRGKLLNVKDQNIKKIADNDEINNLKKILGLESGKDYADVESLRYGRIMIMTDQDTDGSHIRGLLFNLFHSLWPSLMKNNAFITAMMTPIVKITKGDKKMLFYNLTEYEDWMTGNNHGKGYNISYLKGLGSSTSEDAKEYFRTMKRIKYIYNEASSDDKINLAFDKKKADERKAWLGEYDRNRILNYDSFEVTYEDFVDKELIHFSNYDVERSIPNICDGLKVSQRKILFTCFKRNLTHTSKEIKVAQLAGAVAEITNYHHGEASLQSTIIGMAQDFVGSNNINMLLPIGCFGSRRLNGADSASPRYIHTKLSQVVQHIFIKDDMDTLTYKNDDGVFVEPDYYMPIIPMVLVNGALGIGTGFSCNVPCYNPIEVTGLLRKLLDGQDIDDIEIAPWYRGFKGAIVKNEQGKYVSKGIYKRLSATKIEILELPIGTWTQDFKVLLEELLDKEPTFKNYESHYTETDIRFILHFTNTDEYLKVEDNGYTKLENTFKLVSSKGLQTTNMHLFNANCQIRKYHKVTDIVKEYFSVRLMYYQKRKENILKRLQFDIDILMNKIRFIKAIVAEVLFVHKMKKADLELYLETEKYMPDDNDNFDYITRIPIYNLTIDKVNELEADLKKVRDEFDQIDRLSIQTWWGNDLDAFTKSYESLSSGAAVVKTKNATSSTVSSSSSVVKTRKRPTTAAAAAKK